MKKLKTLLADSYILMLKTQNFHWNVKGPMFHSLHQLFQQQYEDLFLAVDLIAERIKALGDYAPGDYASYQKLSKIKDSQETNSTKMIKELINSHKILINTCEKLIKENICEVTNDLAIKRKEVHEKHLWMLSTLLE